MPLLTTAPRFLSRSACSRRGHYSPLRRKCRRASAGLFSGLRGSLCRGSRRLRAFCHALPVRDAVTIPRSAGNAAGLRPACFPACAAHCAAAHDGSALLCCHAARPPRRATARPSAKNTLRLRRNCFFACGSRCCPAPRRSALLCCHAARPPRRATARPSAKNTLRLRRNCFFACGSRCCPAPGRSALLCRGGPRGRPRAGVGTQPAFSPFPIWPRPHLPLRRTPRRGPISTVYTARSFML